jgi:hypothetical protein
MTQGLGEAHRTRCPATTGLLERLAPGSHSLYSVTLPLLSNVLRLGF